MMINIIIKKTVRDIAGLMWLYSLVTEMEQK